jgi:hypothetical protein
MCYGYEGWFRQRRAAKPVRNEEPAQPERRMPEPAKPPVEELKPTPVREREREPA